MPAVTTCQPIPLPPNVWFRDAAQLGHGQAQLMLGRYLAERCGR